MSPICLWLQCYSEPLDPAALFMWHAGRAGAEQGNPVLSSGDLSLEQMEIGFIIPAGPEDRGSSKLWSLSWTSVFLPVGAGVFVLTGQSTWAYSDSAWRKGSLLRRAWKCIWAWKEACFAQISYPALVPPFPHMFVLDLPLLFWNGAAAFLKALVRNSLLCRRPRSETVTEQMGAGHARKLGLTLSRRLLIYPGSCGMSLSETSKQGELMLTWGMKACTLHWGLRVVLCRVAEELEECGWTEKRQYRVGIG